VALRPNTPLTATVIGTIIIVGMALLVDAAYAWGWLPASVVHARPLLLYADGEVCCFNCCTLQCIYARLFTRCVCHDNVHGQQEATVSAS
jgi:hypothetical protein